MTADRTIKAAAIDWTIRQRDPEFAEWEAFADWLAADPAHGDAYHQAQALDDELSALPPPTLAPPVVVPLPARKPLWSRRSVWMSGAIAASVAVLVGVSQLAPSTYPVETAMGEQRELVLADGSRIEMNGGTLLLLDKRDERKIRMEHGQALFIVVHRAEAPFRVSAGESRFVNIGTIFDVTQNAQQTSVAVSEGAVAFNPDSENVRIDAGKRLTVSEASGEAVLTSVDAAQVGGWREGQLIYDGVPLAAVAAEVERTTGFRIRTTADTAGILFRGALNTGADAERLAGDLAALSGTRAVRDAEGWTLSK